jgi:ankyrin repeat protein
VAAINNTVDDIDGLLDAGCEVNYNGASFSYDVEYENEYGEGDANETADYEFVDTNATTITFVIAGITALDIAAYEGSNKTVAKLLTVPGIELDIVTSLGATPLTAAPIFGYTKIIEMLAQAGADINHQDNDGLTLLHYTSFMTIWNPYQPRSRPGYTHFQI